ncbi:MAG: hypothetical protein WC488_05390 [Candidatus Micrarchaeia archaeon]
MKKKLAAVFLAGLLVGALGMLIAVDAIQTAEKATQAEQADMTRYLVMTQGQPVPFDLLGPGTYRCDGFVDKYTVILVQIVPTADIPRLVCDVPKGLIRKDGMLVKYEPERADWY